MLVIALLHQQTSSARSRPAKDGKDGRVFRRTIDYQGRGWEGYAVNTTPAVAVDHGILELFNRPVSLAVSGINYGANVGTCVTVSGTVGAALQAAEHGIPAIAISLELKEKEPDVYTLDGAIDFSAAVHFLSYFAERALKHDLSEDVDVLKIEIPADAAEGTHWIVARQNRFVY